MNLNIATLLIINTFATYIKYSIFLIIKIHYEMHYPFRLHCSLIFAFLDFIYFLFVVNLKYHLKKWSQFVPSVKVRRVRGIQVDPLNGDEPQNQIDRNTKPRLLGITRTHWIWDTSYESLKRELAPSASVTIGSKLMLLYLIFLFKI